MKSYTFPRNSKTEKLADLICRAEDLGLEFFDGDTVLGDPIIEVFGAGEDIDVFIEVFEMVNC